MTAKKLLEIGVVGVRMAQEKANQPETETGNHWSFAQHHYIIIVHSFFFKIKDRVEQSYGYFSLPISWFCQKFFFVFWFFPLRPDVTVDCRSLYIRNQPSIPSDLSDKASALLHLLLGICSLFLKYFLILLDLSQYVSRSYYWSFRPTKLQGNQNFQSFLKKIFQMW